MENVIDTGEVTDVEFGGGFDEPSESTENVEQVEEVVEGEQQQEATPKPRTSRDTKITVDGKEYNVPEKTLLAYNNLPPDTELTDREYKSFLGSYKQAIHFNNNNRIVTNQKEQFDKFIEMMETNPKETLKQMFASKNADLIKIAEDLLMEQIENEMLDPKEKELKELRAEKERYAKQLEEQKKQQEQAEQERLSNQYIEQFETEIIHVLENSDLPRTEGTIKRLANYKLLGLQKGVDIPFTKIAELVEQDIETEIAQLFGAGKSDKLMRLLGEERLKEIRKTDLDRVKKLGNQSIQKTIQPTTNPKTSQTPDDFAREAKKRLAQMR